MPFFVSPQSCSASNWVQVKQLPSALVKRLVDARAQIVSISQRISNSDRSLAESMGSSVSADSARPFSSTMSHIMIAASNSVNTLVPVHLHGTEASSDDIVGEDSKLRELAQDLAQSLLAAEREIVSAIARGAMQRLLRSPVYEAWANATLLELGVVGRMRLL